MTVKELMKVLAGTPGDMEVYITTGTDHLDVCSAERVETSEDGEYLLLSAEELY